MNRLKKVFLRISGYYYKRGLLDTINYAFKYGFRAIFQDKYYIYYADLKNIERFSNVELDINVVCRKSRNEISDEENTDICAAIDHRIWNDECDERFMKGAILWLAQLDGRVAGIVWSVNKHTIEPYFFPLQDKDIHLFDNLVLEKYRGKNINAAFIDNILRTLSKQGYERAYIETKIWNHQEMQSLKKTAFRNYAIAKKYILFQHVELLH